MKIPSVFPKLQASPVHPNPLLNALVSTTHFIRVKSSAQPLSLLRLIFWASIWVLSVVELAKSVQLFKISLNFILTPNQNARVFAIEDSRRQAIPVLIMVSTLLAAIMPFIIILPIYGILKILSRMVVEIAWTSVLSLLLMGAAAGLAPISSSPRLPKDLQPRYAQTIGIAFGLFILLFSYTLTLLLLHIFHQGRGTSNLLTSSLSGILYPSDHSSETLVNARLPSELEKSAQDGPLPTFQSQPSEFGQARDEAWSPSSTQEPRAPSSGWDDDEDEPRPGSRRERLKIRK